MEEDVLLKELEGEMRTVAITCLSLAAL